jgi:hypothetical protein
LLEELHHLFMSIMEFKLIFVLNIFCVSHDIFFILPAIVHYSELNKIYLKRLQLSYYASH